MSSDDWDQLFYVFSVDVFLSVSVYAAIEQGLKLLRHRVALAERKSPLKGRLVGRAVTRTLDLLATPQVWRVVRVDSYVHSCVLTRRSVGLVTRGVHCEHDWPLQRHPWYPRNACMSFRSIDWMEVKKLPSPWADLESRSLLRVSRNCPIVT